MLLVPWQYILSLAASTNEVPLPSVQEAFGIRLPPPEQCLVQPDFELIPNMPPEEDALYEEIEEEVTDDEADAEVNEDEDEEDEDEDVEMQDGNVNGLKQEHGMDVEGGDREGSDLFDGDEDEAEARGARRPVEEDEDYD